jgi:5-methylcytosine-specific restriction protein B
VFLPPNLYVIGTMNVADRSLALVDLALRRRFAFVELEPQLNERWTNWLTRQGQMDRARADDIAARLRRLNATIANDDGLGPQYRIGHSYVTPAPGATVNDARRWFREIIDSEIAPLLAEYWFDRPDRAQEETDRLLAGW